MKLEPKRTAIISLDVQNDLVNNTPGVIESGMLDRMAAVLAAGRKAGAGIIHITASVRADFKDIPKDNPLWLMVRRQKSMVLGTEGAGLHERVAALPGELVLNKTCVDPFLTTSLGQALINADVNTLVIFGLWTNYVVEATARHASDLGYRVFIISDCCAGNDEENHQWAMARMLPTLAYITTSGEVLSALGRQGAKNYRAD